MSIGDPVNQQVDIAAATTNTQAGAATPSAQDGSGPRSGGEALFWAIFLSVLFFAVYSTCNWIASLRDDVGEFYFAWERHIPFVTWMVIPYMSIDLFFFFSPWVCRTRRELRTHAARMILAYSVAAVFFLRFPLKLVIERPPPEGLFGPIFQFLYSVDQPYNLAPSLHLAIRGVLWALYRRHTAGLLRWFLQAWFLLIALSTLFTWQHHVLDVVTGHLLALLCIYLIPYPSTTALADWQDARRSRRPAIAAAFAAPASLLALLAMLWGGWWLFALWPAFALGVMAAAYMGLGAAVFQKSDGKVPWLTRLLLAPYLLVNSLWFRLRRRRSKPWVRLAPGLIVGRRLDRSEAAALLAEGVVAVLDLTGEYDEQWLLRRRAYLNVPVLDLTGPSPRQIAQCLEFIDRHIGRGAVYVHCAMGFSRSPLIAAMWLVYSGRCASPEEAVARVRQARPEARIPDPPQWPPFAHPAAAAELSTDRADDTQ